MYIVENIDEVNINNIYISDSLENTVIDNGKFSKIMYSTPDYVMNGIYVLCSFSDTIVDKIAPNKFKVSWNREKNKHLIDKLITMERDILEKMGGRNSQYQLAKILDFNNVRIFSEEAKLTSNSDFILRISGVWENESICGITYKFLETDACF